MKSKKMSEADALLTKAFWRAVAPTRKALDAVTGEYTKRWKAGKTEKERQEIVDSVPRGVLKKIQHLMEINDAAMNAAGVMRKAALRILKNWA